jgi:hypothetical protein
MLVVGYSLRLGQRRNILLLRLFISIRFHQHGWGLRGLHLTPRDASEPNSAVAIPMRVGAGAGSSELKQKELCMARVLCASDWNISACGSCGQFKNKKKLFVKPPSPYGPGRRPYPHPPPPPMLVSTHLQQPG